MWAAIVRSVTTNRSAIGPPTADAITALSSLTVAACRIPEMLS